MGDVSKVAWVQIPPRRHRSTHGLRLGGEETMAFRKHHKKGFLTTEEKIEKLKEYKEWLDNESKGVEEAISKLKKASLNLAKLFLSRDK